MIIARPAARARLTHADGMRGQKLLVVRPSLICGVMDHRTIGNRAPVKQIHASFFLMTVPIVVSLRDELGAPPGRSERLVHGRFGIGRNVSAVCASQPVFTLAGSVSRPAEAASRSIHSSGTFDKPLSASG